MHHSTLLGVNYYKRRVIVRLLFHSWRNFLRHTFPLLLISIFSLLLHSCFSDHSEQRVECKHRLDPTHFPTTGKHLWLDVKLIDEGCFTDKKGFAFLVDSTISSLRIEILYNRDSHSEMRPFILTDAGGDTVTMGASDYGFYGEPDHKRRVFLYNHGVDTLPVTYGEWKLFTPSNTNDTMHAVVHVKGRHTISAIWSRSRPASVKERKNYFTKDEMTGVTFVVPNFLTRLRGCDVSGNIITPQGECTELQFAESDTSHEGYHSIGSYVALLPELRDTGVYKVSFEATNSSGNTYRYHESTSAMASTGVEYSDEFIDTLDFNFKRSCVKSIHIQE